MASRRSLTDGSVVQFLSAGQGHASRGSFTAALAQNDVIDAGKEAGGYALINALDIAVKTDSQALLDAKPPRSWIRPRRTCASLLRAHS